MNIPRWVSHYNRELAQHCHIKISHVTLNPLRNEIKQTKQNTWSTNSKLESYLMKATFYLTRLTVHSVPSV